MSASIHDLPNETFLHIVSYLDNDFSHLPRLAATCKCIRVLLANALHPHLAKRYSSFSNEKPGSMAFFLRIIYENPTLASYVKHVDLRTPHDPLEEMLEVMIQRALSRSKTFRAMTQKVHDGFEKFVEWEIVDGSSSIEWIGRLWKVAPNVNRTVRFGR